MNAFLQGLLLGFSAAVPLGGAGGSRRPGRCSGKAVVLRWRHADTERCTMDVRRPSGVRAVLHVPVVPQCSVRDMFSGKLGISASKRAPSSATKK